MRPSLQSQLVTYYHHNGCCRMPDEHRRKKEGRKYKKGYEIRLVAQSKDELSAIQLLLKKCGFAVAKPFSKRSQIVQPIYGKESVQQFHNMVSEYS